jgi:hypothetical protein
VHIHSLCMCTSTLSCCSAPLDKQPAMHSCHDAPFVQHQLLHVSSSFAAAVAAVHVNAAAGSFLHTHGQDMPWFQVLMLDVLALYAAVAALACAVLGFSCRRFLRACVSPRFGRGSGGSSRRKQD